MNVPHFCVNVFDIFFFTKKGGNNKPHVSKGISQGLGTRTAAGGGRHFFVARRQSPPPEAIPLPAQNPPLPRRQKSPGEIIFMVIFFDKKRGNIFLVNCFYKKRGEYCRRGGNCFRGVGIRFDGGFGGGGGGVIFFWFSAVTAIAPPPVGLHRNIPK